MTEHNIDEWSRGQRLLVSALSCLTFICLNIIGHEVAGALNLGLYLDCIGTIVAAIYGGFVPSVVCGYLTNIIIGITDGTTFYFSVVNVLIAGLTAYFSHRGYFKKPLKTVVAILGITLVSALASEAIAWFLFGMEDELTGDLARYLHEHGCNAFMATFLANLHINLIDKAITVLVALGIVRLLPQSYTDAADFGLWQQTPLTREDREWLQQQHPRSVPLRHKITIIIAVLLAVVVAVDSYVSLDTYNDSLIAEEIGSANGVLDYLIHEVDPGMVDTYLEEGKSAKGYLETEKRFAELRDSFPRVAYIYAYRVEEDGCHVVFDPDTADLPGMQPGDIVEFDEAFMPYRDDLLAGREIEPVISNESYGWLLTVYRPLYDSSGRCVCYICIDVSMDEVIFGGFQFITRVLALFGAFFVLAAVLVGWLAEYSIVIPLNSIGYVMRLFASTVDDDTRTDSLANLKKLDITTGDEVELLYESVTKTATDMVDYIEMTEKQNETISSMQENLIMVMADLVESRDKYTGDHVRKTARYCEIIMDELIREGIYTDQLTEEFVSNVSHSAPLHDIGKIHVPDAILNKPGRLTAEEFEIMKSHTTAGYEILEQAVKAVSEPTYLDEAKNLAEYHHEKWAGGGYPTGISGEDIPLSARIMAVADVFDALVSKRSYKDGFPLEKAYAIIEEGAGTHFDPQIARAFLNARDKAEEVCRAYGDGQTDKVDKPQDA